jgi:nucleoid-associated protein YgaU
MAHEYEDEAVSDSRVLFGRVAFWLVAIALAFTLGRCTASDGVPRQDLVDARETIAAQAEQLTNASEATAAQAAGGTTTQASPAASAGTATGVPSPAATGASEEASTAPEQGQTYIVESGDTLGGIADKFYGDPALHTLIQEANDLDDGSPLQRGLELIIPPEPEG